LDAHDDKTLLFAVSYFPPVKVEQSGVTGTALL